MNKTRVLAKARAYDAMIEAFTLLLSASDRDFQEAADISRRDRNSAASTGGFRLCDMTPEDLRTLRAALSRLDGMLDALALDRHLKEFNHPAPINSGRSPRRSLTARSIYDE
jgi:hypothetical protein